MKKKKRTTNHLSMKATRKKIKSEQKWNKQAMRVFHNFS